MKKVLSLVLAFTMALTFTACGAGGSVEESPSTALSQTENPSPATRPVSTAPAGESAQPNMGTGAGSLVVYFSWSGNTESVANEIQVQTGADIFEIVPAEPYTDDYNTLLDIAQEEQADGARPAIADTVENFDQYDVVYFGYPNWWYGVPMALLSFLENNDLSGKQIYLFYSHGTGGLADSVSMITEALPGTEISDHIFDCYEEDAPDSEEEIGSWLAELGYSG